MTGLVLLNPQALFGLLLAVPLMVLYLLRPRQPRLAVGTSMFWQQVLPPSPGREFWQRWRGPVSLFLNLFILVLLVAALADPRLEMASATISVSQPASGVSDVETTAAASIASSVPADDAPAPPRWATLLAACGAGLLAVEWCLYQRRWVT